MRLSYRGNKSPHNLMSYQRPTPALSTHPLSWHRPGHSGYEITQHRGFLFCSGHHQPSAYIPLTICDMCNSHKVGHQCCFRVEQFATILSFQAHVGPIHTLHSATIICHTHFNSMRSRHCNGGHRGSAETLLHRLGEV